MDPDSGAESETEVWDSESHSSGDDDATGTCTGHAENTPCIPEDQKVQVNAIVKWLVLFLLSWQFAFTISTRAISSLLAYMKVAFTLLSRILGNPVVSFLANVFPGSVHLSLKHLSIKQDLFKVYAVCGKCFSIYEMSNCIDNSTGQALRCTFQAFPQHRMSYHRVSCKGPLLKQITLSSGMQKYYQINSYPYKSLIQSIERCLCRPGTCKRLQQWRNRHIPDGYYADVYDGKLWKEHADFFSQPRSYGLMLNLDWFQPFKHTTDSVGAMYITIMNLPRNERFKRENVILLGIIPAMDHEPPHVNAFLQPLVAELQELKTGVRMYTSESPRFRVTVRAMLLCAACDIPAGRKLCGFMGHSATLWCSRCLKRFAGGFGSHDCSGFDRDNWPPRTIDVHKQHVARIKNAKSFQEKCKLESQFGVRYSRLLELSYFNPIRHNIVDPMHNLFLGTAKHLLKKIWLERGILNTHDLQRIQTRVDSICPPADIGRIPKKIASGFSNFTADQWKNWTVIYSLFALRDILPLPHYQCWESFVLACRFLCSTVINQNDLKKADLLLLHFCRRVESLYGKDAITPNMHLHAHLRECVHDYGPIYSFWLFSFERYNGILGDIPNNQHSIEVQLMRRFQNEQELLNVIPPSEFHEDFSTPLACVWNRKSQHHLHTKSTFEHTQLFLAPSRFQWPNSSDSLCELPKYRKLGKIELTMLEEPYSIMYPQSLESGGLALLPQSVSYYTHCSIGGIRFGTKGDSRTKKSSYVLATSFANSESDNDLIPAQIEKLFQHRHTHNSITYSNIFALVQWYTPHPLRYKYGKALQIWSRTFRSRSVIPITKIFSRFAPAFGNVLCDSGSHENVLFVCPLGRHLAL